MGVCNTIQRFSLGGHCRSVEVLIISHRLILYVTTVGIIEMPPLNIIAKIFPVIHVSNILVAGHDVCTGLPAFCTRVFAYTKLS